MVQVGEKNPGFACGDVLQEFHGVQDKGMSDRGQVSVGKFLWRKKCPIQQSGIDLFDHFADRTFPLLPVVNIRNVEERSVRAYDSIPEGIGVFVPVGNLKGNDGNLRCDGEPRLRANGVEEDVLLSNNPKGRGPRACPWVNG